MSEVAITRRQFQVLCFLATFRRRWGLYPTLSEIGAELGLSNPTVYGHISGLEDKGLVERDYSVSRGTSLTRAGRRRVPKESEDTARWRDVALELRRRLLELGEEVETMADLYESAGGDS